eukprot:748463-Hanusia_phi.AAC.2
MLHHDCDRHANVQLHSLIISTVPKSQIWLRISIPFCLGPSFPPVPPVSCLDSNFPSSIAILLASTIISVHPILSPPTPAHFPSNPPPPPPASGLFPALPAECSVALILLLSILLVLVPILLVLVPILPLLAPLAA